MPTRRIDDPENPESQRRCRHPEHEPPMHMVFPPGLYEHECPGCGRKLVFRVDEMVWSDGP